MVPAKRTIGRPVRYNGSSTNRRSSQSIIPDSSFADSQDEGVPTPRAPQLLLNPITNDPMNSPFFMHSAVHPGLLIVSFKLDGMNYDDWNAAMRIALDAKNKIGFVDGTILRPAETDLISDFGQDATAWSCLGY